MTTQCPYCHSARVVRKDYGKKAGGTIGTMAGAAVGVGERSQRAANLRSGKIYATSGLYADYSSIEKNLRHIFLTWY